MGKAGKGGDGGRGEGGDREGIPNQKPYKEWLNKLHTVG
jgi:hypothetical protein